ncbi:PAS domain S-box protein [Paraglaciecola aquimarina]|uniref:histidine kinase n=1 Tax=Paraglaciecola aquimarina TaxID=1235557 RepID=A0ABU3SXD9_9ALTE|nr:PAS domain S-box protein [Paraglaciecola aquimarina]MDU0354668.1 PAS domain S-box protein [Paraglaciecola aquimarina]
MKPQIDKHMSLADSDTQAALLDKICQLENNQRAIDRVQAIIEFDLNGYILRANQNFLTIFGYTEQEIVGQHHSIFVDAKFAQSEEYKTFWQTLRNGSNHSGEFSRLDKNNKEVWLQASYNPVLDNSGKVLRFIKYATDITLQKTYSADLQSIVCGLHKALTVVEFDLQGNIVDANQNFLTLMGYCAEELIGQHHAILCDKEETKSKKYIAHWDKLRRGVFQSGEFVRKNKSGQNVHIYATYNPILGPTGKPVRIMKFVNDLSERQAMEMALRQAKDNAEIAAKSKNDFLANMSHEIRTPMNAIIGYTELLLEDETILDAHRQHLSTVHYSAFSLLRLLNDILDTAKLEHGNVALENEIFSLRKLCADVQKTLQLSASQKI